MRKQILMGCLLLAFGDEVLAQAITGRLGNEKKEAVPYANIALLRLPDSTLQTGTLSDTAGLFAFSNLPKGNFLLRINALGFRTFYRPVVLTNTNVTLGDLQLESSHQQLNGVTISGSKPIIEQRLDRLVVNIEGTVMSEGNNALELLGKSPGITVTDDGRVSVKGRTGSMVMINGKQTYLSGQQLVNLLRATNSSDVSRIEIIANPSAKEDAAGIGGIVNIVMKKQTRAGLNGNVSVYAGAGRGARMGGSAMINYRTERINVFGTFNQYFSNIYQRETVEKDFYDVAANGHGTLVRTSRQFSKISPELRSNNFRAGFDWFIDSANTIGVLVNGGIGRYPKQEATVNNLANYPEGRLLQRARTNTAGRERWKDMLYNLNYVHRFNNEGHELTADIDYVYHFDKMDQQLNTSYTGADSSPLRANGARRGDIPSGNDIYVAKVDYTLPLQGNMKLEAGWKGSLVRMENNLQYDTLQNDIFVPDANTSNHFVYKEQIQAGYISFRKDWKSITVQAGLRAENTTTRGDQLTIHSTFTRHYFHLFPSLFVTHTTPGEHKWQLGYSRRIQRPSFWDMNPFRVYSDPFSYYEGNPQLLPSLVNAFEAGHSFRSAVHTVVSYSRATDVSGVIVGTIGDDNITYEKPANLGTSTNYGVSVTTSSSFFRWWTGTYIANLYYNQYKIASATTPIEREGATFTFNSQHTFLLGNGWKAELNGFYNSGGVDGVLLLKSRYQVSAGVQKDVFRGKGNIKLMMNDITKGNYARYTIDYGAVKQYTRNNADSRYGVLSFTWRFGNDDNKTRKRNTGSEEIKGRLK